MLVRSLLKSNSILAAQRDLLLPKLISGEIDLQHFERAAEGEAKRIAAE